MRFLSNYSDNSTRSWSENDPRFYDDEASGKILDAIKIKLVPVLLAGASAEKVNLAQLLHVLVSLGILLVHNALFVLSCTYIWY